MVDEISMKRSFLILLLPVILIALTSCGADKLNKSAVQKQTNTLTANECSFTSLGPPACGMDGKDYLNGEHAECFTTIKSIGHCDCSTHTVCANGVDYNECDAKAQNLTISKYIPCAATEL